MAESPYQSLKDSEHLSWSVVQKAISDLVKNRDIILQTPEDYVIGYLVKQIKEKLVDSNG